jgi:hypothetical protein
MAWTYYISDGYNKPVKQQGGFLTEQEAQDAATAYLDKLKPGYSKDHLAGPVYTVTTGRDSAN